MGSRFSAVLLVGADLLRMSREDLIQICGPADGIRLFNIMKGRWGCHKVFCVEAEKDRPPNSFCGDVDVLAAPAHIFQVYSAPSDHLCVSATRQASISYQAWWWRRYVCDISNSGDVLVPVMHPSPQEPLMLLLCSLPGSVPWWVDPVGPVWEDRCALQPHSTANYTHLPTTPQRDPHIGLRWGRTTRLSPPESHK